MILYWNLIDLNTLDLKLTHPSTKIDNPVIKIEQLPNPTEQHSQETRKEVQPKLKTDILEETHERKSFNETTYDNSVKLYVNTIQLNLRSGPGKDYDVVGKIYQGDYGFGISRAYSNNGTFWIKLQIGNLIGWANEQLLTTNPIAHENSIVNSSHESDKKEELETQAKNKDFVNINLINNNCFPQDLYLNNERFTTIIADTLKAVKVIPGNYVLKVCEVGSQLNCANPVSVTWLEKSITYSFTLSRHPNCS
jgi:hypothetical protein